MSRFLRILLVLPALFWSLAPILWMITIAFKRPVDQFASPPQWFGFAVSIDAFQEIFRSDDFSSYLLNSGIVTVASTLLAMAAGVPAAYALARHPRPRLSFWILSTRMMPPIVTTVPLYLLMGKAGLLNTRAALVLAYAVLQLPFVVWMMRSFFEEIPVAVEESALLDGASRFQAFTHIVLPIAAPGLAATAMFSLLLAWNEFLLALVLTQTRAAMTLPVGIAARVTQFEIRWGVMSAAGLVAIVPVLIFAALIQRYLVRGLTLGAVKG